jgi:hypothetical protein
MDATPTTQTKENTATTKDEQQDDEQQQQLELEEIPNNPIAIWWKDISTRKTPKDNGEATHNVAKGRWTSLTTRVKQDLDDIKEIVRSRPQEFELKDESNKEEGPPPSGSFPCS